MDTHFVCYCETLSPEIYQWNLQKDHCLTALQSDFPLAGRGMCLARGKEWKEGGAWATERKQLPALGCKNTEDGFCDPVVRGERGCEIFNQLVTHVQKESNPRIQTVQQCADPDTS